MLEPQSPFVKNWKFVRLQLWGITRNKEQKQKSKGAMQTSQNLTYYSKQRTNINTGIILNQYNTGILYTTVRYIIVVYSNSIENIASC